MWTYIVCDLNVCVIVFCYSKRSIAQVGSVSIKKFCIKVTVKLISSQLFYSPLVLKYTKLQPVWTNSSFCSITHSSLYWYHFGSEVMCIKMSQYCQSVHSRVNKLSGPGSNSPSNRSCTKYAQSAWPLTCIAWFTLMSVWQGHGKKLLAENLSVSLRNKVFLFLLIWNDCRSKIITDHWSCMHTFSVIKTSVETLGWDTRLITDAWDMLTINKLLFVD